MKKETEKKGKKQSILPFVVIAAISLAILVTTIVKINSFGLWTNLDSYLNALMPSFQIPSLVNLSLFLNVLFETIPMIIISLVVTAFLYYKISKKDALFFAFVISLTGLIVWALKLVFQITRPANTLLYDPTFAFPSGHATITIVFFGLLISIIAEHSKSSFKKYLAVIIFAVIVVAVDISRVYINLHWFSDVIAGLSLGALILSISLIMIKKLEHKFYS